MGAHLHFAHPLRVKALEYRRVKKDEIDVRELAGLLRMGRLPETWCRWATCSAHRVPT